MWLQKPPFGRLSTCLQYASSGLFHHISVSAGTQCGVRNKCRSLWVVSSIGVYRIIFTKSRDCLSIPLLTRLVLPPPSPPPPPDGIQQRHDTSLSLCRSVLGERCHQLTAAMKINDYWSFGIEVRLPGDSHRSTAVQDSIGPLPPRPGQRTLGHCVARAGV